MKTEEQEKFIRCCILGAIGGILMAAGDWLLGCVPLLETDTGMFNRAYYLSGSYDLWKPALVVGMGALGCFFYSFMVKALNTDIDAKYKKTNPRPTAPPPPHRRWYAPVRYRRYTKTL